MSVLFVVTNAKTFGSFPKECGWYVPTVTFAYNHFIDAGLKVTFCSPAGGEAPVDPESTDIWCYTATEEFMFNRPVQTLLKNTTAIKDVDPSQFDIIYFAGGFGPLYDVYNNADMMKVTAQIYDNGGIVSSVGCGVSGLLNVKLSNGNHLINGKRISGYSNEESSRLSFESYLPLKVQPEIEKQGGKYECDRPRRVHVANDNRVITGQNCTSTAETALQVIKQYQTKSGTSQGKITHEALFVLTNTQYLGDGSKRTGWTLPSVAYPYKDLTDLGVKVTFCTPYGGVAPLDKESHNQWEAHRDCEDFRKNKTIMASLNKTMSIKDVDPSKYSIIVFGAGNGAMIDCANNEVMNRVTAQIYENGGIVCATDTGSVGLLNVKLSNGRWLIQDQVCVGQADEEVVRTPFRHFLPFMLEQRMRDQGAQFDEGTPVKEHVVVSNCGRIVTGQNPNSSCETGHVLKRCVKQLGSLNLSLKSYDNVVNITRTI